MSNFKDTSGVIPVGYHVMVKPKNPLSKGEDGEEQDQLIIIPDEVKKREGASADVGTVVSLGDVAYQREDFGYDPWVSPGDVILFSRWAGQVFISPLDNQEYRLLNDEDVMLIFTPEAVESMNKKNKSEE